MTARVIRMVDNKEGAQTWRYQWRETFNGYHVVDTETGREYGMGDGVDMFCPAAEPTDDGAGGPDCLIPGTQTFYDALNAYFENEQDDIEEAFFRRGEVH